MSSELKIRFSVPTVDAKELHKNLGVSTRYDMWIGRVISKYGFEEGVDFCTTLGISDGGRRPTIHYITIGMAKEVCMLDNTKKGRMVRKAYIELENKAHKNEIRRLAGIEVRKELTDKVKDSGENERMHGFAYSSYTKLVYKLCDIEYKKIKDFRNTLSTPELERVEAVEKMIDSLLVMGKQYQEIKSALSSIIKFNQLD
jgi:phage anti-repressor protein